MKLISVIFGIVVSSYALAQSTVDNRIPFVFLNQYFSYSIVDAHQIILSNKVINFKSIEIDPVKKSISLDYAQLEKLKFSNYLLVLKDQNNTVLGKKNLDLAKSDLVIKKFGIPQNATSACLITVSEFTNLEICKLIVSPEQSGLAEQPATVRIDGQNVETKSFVVLKDNKTPIVFEANLSNENFIKLTTKKRIFYPKRIQKSADQANLKIIFTDADLKANTDWSDSVDLNQSALNIPKDSILNLKQDIFFTNANVQNVAVNYAAPVVAAAPTPAPVKVKTPLPKPVDVYIDPNYQYVVEPFTIFAALKGESTGIQATLASDMGKGLKFSYRKKLDSDQQLEYNFTGYQIGVASDVNGAQISNANQLLFSTAAGWRYMYTDSLGVLAEAELKQDLFFKYTAGSTAVEMISGLNKQVTASPFWNFYTSKYTKASLDLAATYILPTSASGVSVKSGTKLKYGVSYQYRYPTGALLLNVHASQRKQNFDDVEYSETDLIMSAGYSFYFL